ncbi:hypothetical protein N0V84_002288 [Fusarium piperis]|uniref:Uncharacterized protein n=1 Tax=Fusarium piperis TaxID=1435070 RepID=A0A9W9BT62_9HYPO|nr:hypothetical protein N0V84_002288 [Fusarium piperis]
MTRPEMMQWELSDAEKRDRELRIRQRDGLANNIGKLPMSVKEITILHTKEIPSDDSIEPPRSSLLAKSIVPAGHFVNSV